MTTNILKIKVITNETYDFLYFSLQSYKEFCKICESYIYIPENINNEQRSFIERQEQQLLINKKEPEFENDIESFWEVIFHAKIKKNLKIEKFESLINIQEELSEVFDNFQFLILHLCNYPLYPLISHSERY